jgi:hypothetical protein
MDDPSDTITWTEAGQEIEPGNPAPGILVKALEYGRHFESKEHGVYRLRSDLEEILGLIAREDRERYSNDC